MSKIKSLSDMSDAEMWKQIARTRRRKKLRNISSRIGFALVESASEGYTALMIAIVLAAAVYLSGGAL